MGLSRRQSRKEFKIAAGRNSAPTPESSLWLAVGSLPTETGSLTLWTRALAYFIFRFVKRPQTAAAL
jgi:hypothetical protein